MPVTTALVVLTLQSSTLLSQATTVSKVPPSKSHVQLEPTTPTLLRMDVFLARQDTTAPHSTWTLQLLVQSVTTVQLV